MKSSSAVAVLEANTAALNDASPNDAALDDSPPRKQAQKPGGEMFVRAIKDFSSLEQHIPAWEELAAAALEPNPFYESWMLIPALRTLGAGKDLQLVLIFAPDKARPTAPPVLCGVFPLERKPRYKGLPVSTLSLWKHLYCFLCAPLVRADCARQCLMAFF